jgi:Xaa-Pro dipeptidase
LKPTDFNPSRRATKVLDEIQNDTRIRTKPEIILLANSTTPHCDNSFFYLTGFAEGLFEQSYLSVSSNGSLSLLTSEMEKLVAEPRAKGISIITRSQRNALSDELKKLVGSSPKTIGLNYSELTVQSLQSIKSAFRASRFIDVSEALKRARLIKDEIEIGFIQRACDISSRVFRRIPSIIDRQGITENEVAAEMGFEAQKMGGGSVPFDTIVAFGRNSAVPHHFAGPSRLRRGDFVLLDYGAKCERYCSDVTRTLVFGRSTKTQCDMYDVVHEANELGIDNCVVSNTGEEVNSKIGSFLRSKGYSVLHGYGHSIGLSVHDGHGLDNNPDYLRPGMVITVEPAVYLPELGGVRIEDDILITKGKPRILTSASRELIELQSRAS